MTHAAPWPVVPLGSVVVETQYGTSAKSNEVGRGRPVLRMNNLTYEGRFDLRDIKWVELPDDESEKLSLVRGDLLFNRTNSRELVGKTGVWDGPDGFTFAGYLIRVRVREDRVLPAWISAFMNSKVGKTMLFHMAKPSINMANISATDLLRLEVPIAPLEHQQRVVAQLDATDAIRRKRAAATALTDELLRSAFFEMFGDPLTNPKRWPMVALADLGTITTGNTPSRDVAEYFGDEIEWIKSDNINTPSHYLTRAREGLSRKGRAVGRTVPAGSSLITCIAGSPDCIGNVALADRDVAFNQQINAVTPKAGVDHRFLYALLLVGKKLIQSASTNSMKGMVSKGKLEHVLMPSPPRALQEKFGAVFERVVALSRHAENAALVCDDLFDALTHRGFRGELVNDERPKQSRMPVSRQGGAAESFLRLDFELIARQVFDQLLVLRPDALVEGLFKLDRQYMIVAPTMARPDSTGKTLKDWFEHELRPMGMPIHLVDRRPSGAIELHPRCVEDVAVGRGVVRTWPDLQRDLALWLPREIPYLGVREDDRVAVILVERPLSPAEEEAVERTFDRLGSPLPMRLEVVADPPTVRPRHLDRIELRPARLVRGDLPDAVRQRLEDDEEFWREQALRTLVSSPRAAAESSPLWSDAAGRSCLVATTFLPANIRSYLSIYPTVLLVAPLKEQLTPTFEALGISMTESVELARRGVLRFLLPQSIERYSTRWIADVLEGAPESVVFSRRLAAAALEDQRRRNPLFALSANAYERRALLRALAKAAEVAPPGPAAILRSLAKALTEHWAAAEYTMHVRGAMASLSGGLASFGSAVAEEVFKKDLFIEIGAAAQDVEWAGAFGAHLVPEHGSGYSSQAASELLIALSSGSPKGERALASTREFEVAEELLAFDNDTDVVEFVSELGTGDLARFRSLVQEIAGPTRTPEEAADLVRAWNAQVRHYERRPDRVKSFNLVGLLLAAGSALSGDDTVRTVVPLVSLLLPFLLTKANEDTLREAPTLGQLLDWANGTLAGASPPAVLLSRMRKRVAGMKVAGRGPR